MGHGVISRCAAVREESNMNTRFSWKSGEMPKAGTLVWVRHDDQPLYWSYLPEGASRTDIEKGRADHYDFGKWHDPIQCQATIIKDEEQVDQWQFTILSS